MSLSDSRVVENQPHDEEVVLSDEDSLLEKDDTIEATGVEEGSIEMPPGHYDTEETGYDDLMSESDVRSSHDDKFGMDNSSEYGKSEEFMKTMSLFS